MSDFGPLGEAQVRLRFDLAYDGTDFHGWALQPGLRTVQGELEAVLAVLLRTERGADPRLTVGGRTDAGVHARGQVAHLDVAESDVSRVTARRLNGLLQRGRRDAGGARGGSTPPDVLVHTVRDVPRAFDARFGALSRRYEYRLWGAGMRPDPLAARYTAVVPRVLDLAAMREASAELIGLQDFTTFCKARDGATAVRELLRFDWRETEDGAFAATLEADAFCHSMVRALIGAVVAVGSARIDGPELLRLRDARARSSRFAVMPAHGLSLEEIRYPEDAELAGRAEQTRARRAPISGDLGT